METSIISQRGKECVCVCERKRERETKNFAVKLVFTSLAIEKIEPSHKKSLSICNGHFLSPRFSSLHNQN